MVLAVAFAASWMWIPGFGDLRNLAGLASSAAPLALVACAALFPITAGHLDLSIEGTLALGGVLAAIILATTDSPPLAVGSALSAGALVGLINGGLVVGRGLPAVPATLVSMVIVRGAALAACGGTAMAMADPYVDMAANASWMRVPMPVWIALACLALAAAVYHGLGIGHRLRAAHHSQRPDAPALRSARLAGYVAVGAASGMAGVLEAAQQGAAQPLGAMGFSLDVLSACALGGLTIRGGPGSVGGVALGICLMALALNVTDHLAWPWVAHGVLDAAILIGASLVVRARRRRRHIGDPVG
jgi:L-arabinose transport system permease protein